MVQKGFRFLIFYQPSVPHLKFPSTQIIVDFLHIYREIFSIFVIMFFMIKKPEKIFKNKSKKIWERLMKLSMASCA